MRSLAVGLVFAVSACSDPATPSSPAALAIVSTDGSALAAVAFPATATGGTSQVSVRILNIGDEASGAMSLGATGPFTIVGSSTCAGATLAPDADCTIDIAFAPTAGGSQSGVLTVAGTPGGTPTAALNGSAVAAMVTLAPNTIDFGTVSVGATSSPIAITVTNTSTLALTPGAATVTGTGFAIASNTCTGSIAASGNCAIGLTFAPTALGAATGSLALVVGGTSFTATLAGGGASLLTIVPAGTGTGTVTSTPAGIACGATCSASFTTAVTLTAVPQSGSVFTSWSDASCTTTTCNLPVSTAARTITATFTKITNIMVTPSPIDFDTVQTGTTKTLVAHIANIDSTAATISITTAAPFAIASSSCGATLAGNASCDLNLSFTPTALGPVAGTLDVVANGADHNTTLSGIGARRITVTVVGPGGNVTSSPDGINCGAGCTSLFTMAVTLTATAAVGSMFASWSDTSCGTSSTCTIPAGTSAVAITATFVASNAVTLALTFAGNGTGSVHVRATNGGTIGDCTANCTLPLTPGTTYELTADTAQNWGDFAGSCSATPPAGQCTFTASAAAAETVTFTKDPKELFNFIASATPTALAFDPHDNVIIGDAAAVTKVGPTGTQIWKVATPATGLATGSDDRVYVVSGSMLVALDASGTQLWSKLIGTSCGNDTYARPVASAPNNNVVALSSAGITMFDPSGAILWSHANVATWKCEVAIDSADIVYVGNADQPEEITAARFSATGTALTELGNVAVESNGNFAITSGDHIGGTASGFHKLTLSSETAAEVSEFSISNALSMSGALWTQVAAAATRYVWAFSDFSTVGYTITVRGTDNSILWTLSRPALVETNPLEYGWLPTQIAGSASGRVAIGGKYIGIATQGPLVQVFAP